MPLATRILWRKPFNLNSFLMKRIYSLIFCIAVLALPPALNSCQGIHSDWEEYQKEPKPKPEPEPETNESSALVFYFTGTWCTYCPNMSKSLSKINERLSGRLITVSVHKGDNYSIGYENDFCKRFSVNSFPSAIINYEPTVFGNNEEILFQAANRHLESVKKPCAITITPITDSPNKAQVAVKVAESGKYRIFAALMQDGIKGFQVGQGSDYTFNNVVRALATSPDGAPLIAADGSENLSEGATVNLNISASYNGADGCYWTVAVLKEHDKGIFIVNNAAKSQQISQT